MPLTKLQYHMVSLMASSILFSCTTLHPVETSRIGRHAVWQYSPVIIDGNDSEWTIPNFFSLDELGLSYSITNNQEDLYILFKVKDELMQARVLRAGMSVRIKRLKAKKGIEILFPLPSSETPQIQKILQLYQCGEEPLNARIWKMKVQHATLIGYSTEMRPHQLGLKLGVNQSGQLIYEAKIPIRKFFPDNKRTFLKDKDMVSISLDFPALSSTELAECRKIAEWLKLEEIVLSQPTNQSIRDANHGFEKEIKFQKLIKIAISD